MQTWLHFIFWCIVASLLTCCHLIQLEADDIISDDELFSAFDSNEGNYLERRRLHRLWNAQATKRLHNLNEYQTFRNDYLKHILRVRVPGTLGHNHVKNFIKNMLEKFEWTVELDEFSTHTPLGVRKFTNIIGTLHPKADRVLAVAAHYDSKDPNSMNLDEGEYFLGATDSAVPCAMMLDFAKLLSDRWKGTGKESTDVRVTPMLVFLDGEEAFKTWTDTDSLYGSRHLAEEFATRPHHNKILAAKDVTVLDSLEAFVLLDLIGTKSPPPQFWDLYSSTSKLYSHIQNIENEIKDTLTGRKETYFPGKPNGQVEVEDDHKPFLLRGVPILHLIPIPFPESWHKVGDNEDSLDEDTIVNLLHIFRQFLKEYFDLQNS